MSTISTAESSGSRDIESPWAFGITRIQQPSFPIAPRACVPSHRQPASHSTRSEYKYSPYIEEDRMWVSFRTLSVLSLWQERKKKLCHVVLSDINSMSHQLIICLGSRFLPTTIGTMPKAHLSGLKRLWPKLSKT